MDPIFTTPPSETAAVNGANVGEGEENGDTREAEDGERRITSKRTQLGYGTFDKTQEDETEEQETEEEEKEETESIASMVEESSSSSSVRPSYKRRRKRGVKTIG
ncbi:unnamed protein product [Brassica rapa subsp. trilocularis]|uniref:Uncharacterized protein n=1 Tax=Brassica campestris TaxID=3711 RepID=M4FCQ0_BRACM